MRLSGRCSLGCQLQGGQRESGRGVPDLPVPANSHRFARRQIRASMAAGCSSVTATRYCPLVVFGRLLSCLIEPSERERERDAIAPAR